MARYTGPKCKICRREGIPLAAFGDYEGLAARTVQKKNYPPGAQGKKGSFKKTSEYGKQLREKQKTKRLFGIMERQFVNYYKQADAKEEATHTALLKLLEIRLDNVIYRSCLAKTRRQARQMVTHGLFKLNGKRVDIPSISLKVGDKIVVRDKSKNSPLFDLIKKQKLKSPKWLKTDLANLSCEVLREPDYNDCEQLIDPRMIVEFYSK